MPSHRIKNINVQVVGNDAAIEVNGEFPDAKYVFDRIDIKRTSSAIEIYIITHYDENVPANKIAEPFRKNIAVAGLQPGVHYVRIDNNNNWVKWFKIDQIIHQMDMDQFQHVK